MRERKRTREIKVDICLVNLNHKINRKAFLLSCASRFYNEAKDYHYENWMIEDECISKGNRYLEAFNQTLATPVGGYVDCYIM